MSYLFTDPYINKKQFLKLASNIVDRKYYSEGVLSSKATSTIKKILNVKYCSLCTSGTSALHIALKSLGIGKNDQVIMPEITFPATFNAIKSVNAIPVTCKVDNKNLLINSYDLKKKINKKTKAIITVHLSGRGSNIREVKKIAKENNLYLIEDSAEALFSKNSKKYLGTFGDVGCYSFAPNKIITSGQGGLLVTNNKNLYKFFESYKDQGRERLNSPLLPDYFNNIGFNFRVTELQAALLIVQLKNIKFRIKKLIQIYQHYKLFLKKNNKIKLFNFNIQNGEFPLWVDAKVYKRDELITFLKKFNIQPRPFWRPIGTKKNITGNLLWLPSNLHMNKAKIKFICKKINLFYER